jgi:hypothetical protein
VQREPGQQGPAPAEGVGERTDHQLPERQPGQRAGEGELHGGRGGAQVVGDRRQGRQVHVDGQRTDRDQGTEHDDEADTLPEAHQLTG